MAWDESEVKSGYTFAMSRILVIGVNGYLGSHVLKHFERKDFEVWRGVRGKSAQAKPGEKNTIYLEDQVNENHSFESEFACVILCGSPDNSLIEKNPIEYLTESVFKPYIWLSGLTRFNIKQIIWVGSFWQEPLGNGYKCTNLYSASKQAMQDLLASFVLQGIHVNVIHLGDLFGPRDRRQKLIPTLIKSITENQQLLIHNPEHVMRPIWYLDVLEGFEYLVKKCEKQKPGFEIHSMVGPEIIQVKSVVATVMEALGGERSLITYSKTTTPAPYSGATKYDFPIGSFQQTPLIDGIKSIKDMLLTDDEV